MTELTSFGPVLDFFLALFAGPVRRCLILSTSALLKYFETKYHPPMAARKTTTKGIRIASTSHLHHFVEQIGTQANARAQQLFVELGTNTGRRKTPHYLAVRIDPAFIEHEQILQRDYFAFHSGDLGHGGHAARTVAHTRRLDKNVDCAGDLLTD